MLTSARRLASAALALALGVGFIAAALMLATSMDATLRAAAGGAIRDAQAVITEDPDTGQPPAMTDAYVAAVEGTPGVDRVRATVTTYALAVDKTNTQMFTLLTVPELSDRTRLVAGRLPEAPREALVNTVAARVHEWTPGDTLTLEAGNTVTYTIVGVLDGASDTTTDPARPHAFLTMPDIGALSGRTSYTDLYVHGTGSPEALVTAIKALPATAEAGATVLSAAEASDLRITQYTRGSEQLTIMLLAFGAVAAIVAGLVVANTFAILVAQRTRQLALLRTVGATREQVFRTVVVEAAVLGLVASAIGLALGVAAVAATIPFTQSSEAMRIERLAVTPRDILVPLFIGVVLAVVAALVPARQATRVAPLAALRPQVATAVDPRARQGRPVLALLATVIGFALLGIGGFLLPSMEASPGLSVLVGIAGGLLSVAGVLALGTRIVPAVARALGGGLRRVGGVPAELAADNAVRNPGRAAATTGALLVGVTLVTMMTVGAATGQASIQRDLDRNYPVDVTVESQDRFTDAQIERARTLPEVAGVTVLRSFSGALPDSGWLSITGFDPDAKDTLRDPGLLAGLADGVLLVGPDHELTEGSRITLTVNERPVPLTVTVNPHAGRLAAVTAATFDPIQPDAPRTLGIRLADGVEPVVVSNALAESLAEVGPGVHIISAAEQRALMQQLIDTVLLVVLGLLAVAVVIAIVGIGNTLGLSVHERRQESGLLRAMGLTRGQLRASLGWEAVLLAAVAVLLGLALGVAYGFAGVSALVGADAEVVPSLPWARLALIAATALLAGWLASVLPSIRAAKVPPAAALALGE